MHNIVVVQTLDKIVPKYIIYILIFKLACNIVLTVRFFVVYLYDDFEIMIYRLVYRVGRRV